LREVTVGGSLTDQQVVEAVVEQRRRNEASLRWRRPDITQID
jgi:hypothetical protein